MFLKILFVTPTEALAPGPFNMLQNVSCLNL